MMFGRGRSWLAGAPVAMLVLAACSGSSGLEIVGPMAGAVVTVVDDVDPATVGVQIEVTVATPGATAGEPVTIQVNGSPTAPQAALDGETLTFVVTLDAGPNTLRADVVGRAVTSETITVTLDTDVLGCPSLNFVTPEVPPAGVADLLLGPADDQDGEACGATFEARFVLSTNAADGTLASLQVNGVPAGTAAVTANAVTFNSIVMPGRGDTANAVTASLEVAGCGSAETSVAFPVPVRVDCAGPSCSIAAPTSPDGFLGQGDDADRDADGFQADIRIDTDATAPVSVEIDGLAVPGSPMTVEAGSASFPRLTLDEGLRRVRATCTDDAGNQGVGFAEYTVDMQPCDIAITSPMDGDVFTDASDVDAAEPGIQVDVTGTASGEGCTAVTVFLDGSAAPAGTFEPSWTRRATLGSVEGLQTLRAVVEDQARNAGVDAVEVRVRTTAPMLRIEDPESPATFTTANDLTPGNDTCEARFSVLCSDVGVDVELVNDDTEAVLAATPCAAVSGLPDGFPGQAVFETVTLPNVATFEAFNVVARQSADTLTGQSPAVSVQSDCVAPLLFFSTPLCAVEPVVLRPATEDQDPDADGVQFDTIVQNPVDPNADVTLTIRPRDGGEAIYTAVAPSPGSIVTFADASYGAGGELSAEVQATDVAGNVGTATCDIDVFDLPTLDLEAPVGDVVLTASADCDARDGFQIAVRATTDAEDGASATVTIDGIPNAVTVAAGVVEGCFDANDGRDLTGTVAVTDRRGTATATFMYDVDTLPPTTAIDPPTISVVDRRAGTVGFSWTAVGDQGGFDLSSYLLRCSDAAIDTEEAWDDARSFDVTTAPGMSGAAQSEDIEGFRVGETLGCVLRGVDAGGALTPLPAAAASVDLTFTQVVVDPTGTVTNFGKLLTPVGDVDGDGVDDLLIAADNEVQLYFGGTTLGTATSTRILGPAGVFFADAVGSSIAAIGDVNDDGRSDFAIGARFQGTQFEGAAYIFFGRETTNPWPATITLSASTCGADACFFGGDGLSGGPDQFGSIGWSLSAAGDFDGDGIDDIALGAPGSSFFLGRVYVILGSATLGGITTVPLDDPDGFILDGNTTDYQVFGSGVASVGGDVTGDTRDDIIIGSPGSVSPSVDGVAVFVAGRAHVGPGLTTIPISAYVDLGTGGRGSFGLNVQAFGDINGDGRLDVGAFDTPSSGSVSIFLGEVGGFTTTSTVVTYQQDFSGGSSTGGDDFGFAMAMGAHPFFGTIGDIDEDGFTDVFLGAREDGDLAGTGDFFYRDSGTALVGRSEATFREAVTSGDARANYGGDLDDDGFTDLIIGDPEAAGGGRLIILH